MNDNDSIKWITLKGGRRIPIRVSQEKKKEKTLQDKLKERLTKSGGTADGKTQQAGRDEQGRKASLREVCEGYRKEIARIQQQGVYRIEDETVSRRLSGFMERRLGSEYSGSGNGNKPTIIKNKQGKEFKIYSDVKGDTFQEIFGMHKKYIENGELVDLHQGKGAYNNCKCFLSSDGLQGLAIEPNGNIVSVFNADTNKKGWVKASLETAVKNGGDRLDCYNSEKQPLAKMYGKYEFEDGKKFVIASAMKYNMDYDHDDIAKKHNKPDVVFMALTNGNVVPMKFGKDDYDRALQYRDYILDKRKNKGE
nr:MAG TPA: hypothetical protein [Caudoviricetes sp.]